MLIMLKSEVNIDEMIGAYPEEAQMFIRTIREMVLQIAENLGVEEVLETKRWGELSFIAKGGSTIRVNWNPATPAKCYIFFICTTKLVSTFQMIFGEELDVMGNRAIGLDMKSPLPKEILHTCLSMALQYQKVKKLPLLGYS